MKISEALQRVTVIDIGENPPTAFRTAAEALAGVGDAQIVSGASVALEEGAPGVFRLLEDSGAADAIHLRLAPDGSGSLTTGAEHLLCGFVAHLLGHRADAPVTLVEEGRTFTPAFAWQRPVYDFFLTQEGRIQRGLDPETYVAKLARSGFTHVEVNGLASPMGIETGPAGETYPMFYTYCPALDQFVESELNRGIYPRHHLSANLRRLKRVAGLATHHGLVPGLLCFEPRSVPEALFARYPMLRGARVDHPFRSFEPRYNLTVSHPLVRAHYAEMLTQLISEVPELGFLSIWTNDSGAGFEYTDSLYVGRNGGPYLIREWRSAAEIARAAGENALGFLRTLRDAGRALNPDFRVLTRMESFYGEHEVIWSGLADGLEVESASLVARGWEMPYTHPRYPDVTAINAGSIYQTGFEPREQALASELEQRASRAHFYFSAGPQAMFAPLLGVPYPRLTAQRLAALHGNGVSHLAHLGGTHPPELVPFDANHEMLSAFQFDPGLDVEQTTGRIARQWAGPQLAEALLQAWKGAEEAIGAFPNVTPLYSTHGFTWYRLWLRPLVPDIEAIPLDERRYYQDFMCTTPHNPNNVDLARDVLFQLTTPEACRKTVERIDAHLWAPLDAAIEKLVPALEQAREELGAGNVIEDHYIRLAALRCWFMTQRNVAAWIAGVHGFLEAPDDAARGANRELLHDMMQMEIENTRLLLDLLGSGVAFMALTDQGETPLIHGDNIAELLLKRIALMEAHFEDEPRIDPDYTERQAAARS